MRENIVLSLMLVVFFGLVIALAVLFSLYKEHRCPRCKASWALKYWFQYSGTVCRQISARRCKNCQITEEEIIPGHWVSF